MRIAALVILSLLFGIAAGYGSLWSEFVGVPQQFEPNSDVLAKVQTHGQTETRVVDLATAPRAVVLNGQIHNFGTGQRGTELEHVFQFQNAGKSPLELTVGHSTCKCTVGELRDKLLPPGQTTEVKLTWKLNSLEEEFHQSAEIYTNDPTQPTIVLEIKGLVMDKVRVKPDALVLGEVPARTGTTGQFFLFGYTIDSLQVIRQEFLMPQIADYFEVTFVDYPIAEIKDEPHATCAVAANVTVLPGLPLGPFGQTIRIVTDVPGVGDLDVVITGTVVSDISLVGAQVFDENKHVVDLGTVEHEAGAAALLHILVKGPYRDEVQLSVGAIDPPDELAVELGEPKKLRDGAIYMVPLTIAIPKDARPINRLGSTQGPLGKIIIDTTHPTAKTLPIYVRFAVK
jgi:hypothetical protein